MSTEREHKKYYCQGPQEKAQRVAPAGLDEQTKDTQVSRHNGETRGAEESKGVQLLRLNLASGVDERFFRQGHHPWLDRVYIPCDGIPVPSFPPPARLALSRSALRAIFGEST